MTIRQIIDAAIAGTISTGKLLELIPYNRDLADGLLCAIEEMKARPRRLEWGDLNVRWTDWKNRKGELRVHVSLKGASFIMHTFWLKEGPPQKPETRAFILLEMHRELSRKLRVLDQYIAPK